MRKMVLCVYSGILGQYKQYDRKRNLKVRSRYAIIYRLTSSLFCCRIKNRTFGPFGCVQVICCSNEWVDMAAVKYAAGL